MVPTDSTATPMVDIGLQNPIWKIIEVAMDDRLKVLELHDCLHGFTAHRGCSTAIMEAKLAQLLAFLEQAPLYEIFIDLRKAFDAMDRERCLKILKDRGVGKNIRRLIWMF